MYLCRYACAKMEHKVSHKTGLILIFVTLTFKCFIEIVDKYFKECQNVGLQFQEKLR